MSKIHDFKVGERVRVYLSWDKDGALAIIRSATDKQVKVQEQSRFGQYKDGPDEFTGSTWTYRGDEIAKRVFRTRLDLYRYRLTLAERELERLQKQAERQSWEVTALKETIEQEEEKA